MRTNINSSVRTVERFLKITGLGALALTVFVNFAEARGWLRDANRQMLLEWALNDETGLPIEHPAARAFMNRFPPPAANDRNLITHVTKWKSRLENGPVLDATFNYMRHDRSRTNYVATLAEVREWAAESRYAELPWILGLIGFVEVAGSMILNRWIRVESQRRSNPAMEPSAPLVS
ncbi:MAG: hypothetical protein HYV04_12380 [Deltaproteobacteria bacterium]|nr:hypothetical protein [Deltaproteobacteria bacterium]